ncbi:hypothetical protein PPROV_000662600 [Pycnococcus provasolii]|uniref:Uncharacterized protein n=1 Tax=Pycnococcus provasolii TaxID=41880 RepID=A0A830HL32_9CHLO|nr:hypothetical protein PPROV_000662600 [Pycnococcus provasolii]
MQVGIRGSLQVLDMKDCVKSQPSGDSNKFAQTSASIMPTTSTRAAVILLLQSCPTSLRTAPALSFRAMSVFISRKAAWMCLCGSACARWAIDEYAIGPYATTIVGSSNDDETCWA